MKETTKNLILKPIKADRLRIGEIYSDVQNYGDSAVTLKCLRIEHKKERVFFKRISGEDCYLQNDDGEIGFSLSSCFYELPYAIKKTLNESNP